MEFLELGEGEGGGRREIEGGGENRRRRGRGGGRKGGYGLRKMITYLYWYILIY